MKTIKPALETYHRFLDEAGDTAFYGKGKTPIIGVHTGVSLCFMLGMAKFKEPLEPIRRQISALRREIEQDEYLSGIPSIRKKKERDGFFFHAEQAYSANIHEKFNVVNLKIAGSKICLPEDLSSHPRLRRRTGTWTERRRNGIGRRRSLRSGSE